MPVLAPSTQPRSGISTMSALLVEITRLLDGDDPTIADISVETLSRLLIVAQRRIYRDVRSRWNEFAFTNITVADNLAALPDDYESPSIVHFGRQALIPVSETVLRDYWADSGASANGTDLYFARAGNALTFYPAQSDDAVLQGRYYARLADLTDANIGTNPLFQNADDLFVYAALVESADFFNESPKMAAWESKYESIVASLNTSSSRVAYGVGRLQQRGVSICGRGRIVRSA